MIRQRQQGGQDGTARLDGGIVVAWADPRGWVARGDARFDWLSVGERERFTATRRAQDAAGFALGRILVRQAVAELCSVEASTVTIDAVCATCGGPHGKPIVTAPHSARGAVHVSIAHTRTVVVAVAAEVGPIGVDAETLGNGADPTAQIHPTTQAGDALRRWTRAEAVLKADGRGLLVDPDTVKINLGGTIHASIGDEPARYGLTDIPGIPNVVASLAVRLTD